MKEPEIPACVLEGLSEALNARPGNSRAVDAETVRVPENPAGVDSVPVEKFTPEKPIVGAVSERKLPIEVSLIDAVKLSNEKPSLRMAKFVTLTAKSLSG